MAGRRASLRYSTGAIVLHWLLALLLAGEIALGFAMPKDASGFELYQLHKSIGLTILFLTVLRIGWRLGHRPPPPVEGGLGGALAGAVHIGFYVFMLAMPLTGWAVVSTAPIQVPTLIFGMVEWPHLPLPQALSGTSMALHYWIALGGLALFAAHVAGALRHHFLIRDGLLERMAPGGSARAVLTLLVGVVALGLTVLFGLGGPYRLAQEAPALAAAPDGVDDAGMANDAQDAANADAGALETASGSQAGSETDAETGAEQDAIASQQPPAQAAAEPEPTTEPTAEPTAEPTSAPAVWAIQPGASLRFSVENSGAVLNGSFARWSGEITMDPERPETAVITITVDLASATLGDATQDQMLKGPDFLGVSANPTAIWRATRVRRGQGGAYEAEGTLSLKGASRAQPISFTLDGTGARRSVSGTATIDRTAFAVGTGPNAGGLGGTVRLNFAFEARTQ